MLDLSGSSNLQVAALRRMTSNPELAARCDAWLQERGVRGPQHFLTLRFADLAAGMLLFLWMEFDELVDAEMPSRRLLIGAGLVVMALIAGFFGFILFLLYQVHSWWWRLGIILLMVLVGVVENYRLNRKLRRRSQ
jgi:hypothetical protein